MRGKGLKHWIFVWCAAVLQNSAPFHTFTHSLATDNATHN
jgi:hypothetical protein